MNLKSVAISGTKWTTLAKIGTSLFQLLQISILTRFLPVEDFGLVAMALFTINFTNIFVDLGFTSAIFYKQNSTHYEYSSLYWANILVSIVLYVLLLLLTPYISSFYNENQLNKIIPILGLNLILSAIGKLHLTILQKELRFKRIAIIELFSVTFGLIIALLTAIHNFGIYSLVLSTISVSLSSSLIALLINLKRNPIYFYFKIKDIRDYFKIGGYSMAGQVVSFFSNDIDILFIGKLTSSSELGLYNLAKTIASRVYSVVNPIITKVLTPLLSKIQQDQIQLKYNYLYVVRLLTYINIPIYLLIIILSQELLTILYGIEYKEGYLILSFLAIFYCVSSINNPVGSLHVATGRTDLGLKWALFCLGLYPIAIYLTSFLGVNYVAAGRGVLNILLIYPLWRMQLKIMANISWREYISTFYKPFILFLLVSTVIIFFSFKLNLIIISPIPSLILKTIGGIAIYFGLFYWVDREEFLQYKIKILQLFRRNNNQERMY